MSHALALGLMVVIALGPAFAFADEAKAKTPDDIRAGAAQRGRASWYGAQHHGRETASGETFNMRALTAAHRTLPFGTRLRVTNLDNGKTVQVRVNDRGPHVRGRMLDLSYAAARAIGGIGAGIMRIRMEVIAPPTMTAKH